MKLHKALVNRKIRRVEELVTQAPTSLEPNVRFAALGFIGQTKDGYWSVELFRHESIYLRSIGS